MSKFHDAEVKADKAKEDAREEAKEAKLHEAEAKEDKKHKGPKFKVGSAVKVGGKAGTVTECVNGLYSIRLDDKPCNPDGSPCDHEHDTLGCVYEDALE